MNVRLFKVATIILFHICLVYGLVISEHRATIIIGGFLLHYIIHNLGNATGYHKLFSHNAFVPVNWYPMVATFLSSISFFGDPLSYAISHRLHHKYADSTRDPHCPRDGLLHSYIGWILKFNPTNKDKLIVSDLIRKYPWTIPYLKIEPLVPIVFYSLIFYISATAGLTILLASVISFQIAICVNMLAHSDDGNGNYTATNNLLSATIVSSIFLHRNHHTSPSLYDYSTDQYVDKWGSFIKRFLTEK